MFFPNPADPLIFAPSQSTIRTTTAGSRTTAGTIHFFENHEHTDTPQNQA